VFTPIFLTVASIVLVLLFAAVVKVLGINLGYKAIFALIAFVLVAKTMFNW
jgi:hypothetical protein